MMGEIVSPFLKSIELGFVLEVLRAEGFSRGTAQESFHCEIFWMIWAWIDLSDLIAIGSWDGWIAT
jgi:hypothetical protein